MSLLGKILLIMCDNSLRIERWQIEQIAHLTRTKVVHVRVAAIWLGLSIVGGS